MHNHSVMALISFIASVGGWFLWNIILSSTYTNNVIYAVKEGFLYRFGQNVLWWLVLVLVAAWWLRLSRVRDKWSPTPSDDPDAAVLDK